MWAYAARRVGVGLALLLALTLVVFALFFASPVDPARLACGKSCTQAQQDAVRAGLGYDAPVHEQWGQFVKGLAVGRDYPADAAMRESRPDLVTHCSAPCLGYSPSESATVNELVADKAPVTISLAVVALVLWLAGGVLLGVAAAAFRGRWPDRVIVGASVILYAFPAFFVGVFLLKYMAIRWGWVPLPEYRSLAEGGLSGWLGGLLLPALTLAGVFLAAYVRMTRSSVVEALSQDYVRTARAKGLSEPVVLLRHATRSAITPLATMAGLDFAALLGGAIMTETVFSYDGLGLLTVQANQTQDLPTLVGLVLVAGTCVIVANIVVDIAYAAIDPRVRPGRQVARG